jgi:hypothetical protein
MSGPGSKASCSATITSRPALATSGMPRGGPGCSALPGSAVAVGMTMPALIGQRGAPVSPPRWLEDWRPEEGPPNAPVATIESFICEVRMALQPATAKAAAVLIEQTLELFGKPDNWDRVADFYLEAVEEMPLDLIDKALRHLRATHRSHWAFPNPADIAAPVRADLAARRLLLMRAQGCLGHAMRWHGRLTVRSREVRIAPAADEPRQREMRPISGALADIEAGHIGG